MNPVRYALLQRSLEIPGIEQLKKAFTAVRCLVDADAAGLANDAYGILVRDLNAEDAYRLQGALQTVGIETELLPVNLLPVVPPTKYVRQVGFGPDALLIFDPIGRPFPVEWRHLMLIAAGNLLTTQFNRRAASNSVGIRRWNPGMNRPHGMEEPERIDVREERAWTMTLELVLTRGVARFSLMVAGSAGALYRCLEERQTGDPRENLRLLVERLAQASPQAMLNRGAWSLRQSPPTLFEYPSKNAFFEEMIWMMHRASQARE